MTPGFLRSEAMLDHFGVTEATWRDATPRTATSPPPRRRASSRRGIAALAADPQIMRKSGNAFGSWTWAASTACATSTAAPGLGEHFEREALSGGHNRTHDEEGCELRTGVDDRNDGVFATRGFAAGDTVMLGVPGAGARQPLARQPGQPDAWVFEDGLGPMVNHSCEPNCGVRVNAAVGGFDFVALAPIAAGDGDHVRLRDAQLRHRALPGDAACAAPTAAAARSRAGRTCPPSARRPTATSSRRTCSRPTGGGADASSAAI